MSCEELTAFTFGRRLLDEGDLKAIVLNELRSQGIGWDRATVASEFRLGLTSVRVDLAVLGKEFVGIEIKSERDSLKRLATQTAAYSKYFDRVIVAVSDRHLANLNWKSLRQTDVWSISESGRISIASQRAEISETSCLSDLLTFSQRERHRLAESPSYSDSRAAFEAEFRKRFGETSETFWDSANGRRVVAADIPLLSRFRDRRDVLSAWAREQEVQWADWNQLVSNLPSSVN